MTMFNILITILILVSPAQQCNRASVTVDFPLTLIVQESRSLIVSGLCFAEFDMLLFQRFLIFLPFSDVSLVRFAIIISILT